MSNICVLFGAGAEKCFNISDGGDFAKSVLGIDTDTMNEAVKEYYKNSQKRYTHAEWYPPYMEAKWKYNDLLSAAVKKQLLDSGNNFKIKKEFDEKIKDNIKLFINRKKGDEIINNHAGYMGLLDERFHTLISPKVLGPKKFWSIVSCYSRAYLLLAGQMCFNKNKIEKDDYIKILKDPVGTMKEMLSFSRRKVKNNYYSILRDYKKPDIKILTTNYTPLCREITKKQNDSIAHLNGRFGLFESPYELKVYDAEKEVLPNELYFPYIFIQSGIKPIVEQRQIKEFSKGIRFLENSNKLIIAGYRINSDDNHINGILRSYLLSDKEIVFLDYDKNSTKQKISDRLRIDPNECRLTHIAINDRNCFSIFDEQLK